jgi:hypothetical protein
MAGSVPSFLIGFALQHAEEIADSAQSNCRHSQPSSSRKRAATLAAVGGAAGRVRQISTYAAALAYPAPNPLTWWQHTAGAAAHSASSRPAAGAAPYIQPTQVWGTQRRQPPQSGAEQFCITITPRQQSLQARGSEIQCFAMLAYTEVLIGLLH